MSSLDDDSVGIDLESGNADEELTDDEVDSHVWSEIQSESDAAFMEAYELIQRVVMSLDYGC